MVNKHTVFSGNIYHQENKFASYMKKVHIKCCVMVYVCKTCGGEREELTKLKRRWTEIN